MNFILVKNKEKNERSMEKIRLAVIKLFILKTTVHEIYHALTLLKYVKIPSILGLHY